MVIGSAGGTKITTAIATVMALQLYAGLNVKEAIDTRRIHHQVMEMSFKLNILMFLLEWSEKWRCQQRR